MMAERERNIVNAADSYVDIDLETTGIGAKREKITEIGMVKVENGAVTDTYHTLVNPGRPIPEHITELTGIDDDMVKDAPMIQDVIGEVIAFCGTTLHIIFRAICSAIMIGKMGLTAVALFSGLGWILCVTFLTVNFIRIAGQNSNIPSSPDPN